jgi:RHS repeat-associated protein
MRNGFPFRSPYFSKLQHCHGSYAIYRRVQERDEYADGSNLSGKVLFSVSNGPVDPNSPYSSRPAITATGTFQDAQGNTKRKESHFFYGNPAPSNAPASNATQFAAWWIGLEWQTQVFAAPFNNPTVVVQRLYSQRGCPGAGEANCWFTPNMDTAPAHDSHVCLAITTLDYLVQSAAAYTYDQYNNLTDQYDFNFGALPSLAGGCPTSFSNVLRHTNTTYLTANATGNYAAPATNIVALPSEIKITDGLGNVYSDTKYGYDENSMTNCASIVGHDNQNYAGGGIRGNLTSVLQYLNTTTTWLPTQMSYDIAGNVVNTLDANGHNTWFSYADAYPDGGRNTCAHLTSTTNHLQQVQAWTYDYGSGQVLSATNTNSAVTHYSYNDQLDRLTNLSNPDGSTSTYNYPTMADIHVFQDQDQSHTGNNGLHSETLYDGFSRPIEYRTYGNPSGYISTTQTYDALGRVSTRSNPTLPGDPNYTTRYEYDALGRSVRTTAPDSAFTTSYYSGNTIILTEEAGNQRLQLTDGLGRLTDVYEDPYGANFRTNYVVDPLNNVRTVTQGVQTRRFIFDSLGRLTTGTNPESGTVTYAYDNVGNLLQRQDGRGIISYYTYDSLDRPQTARYSDSTSQTTFSYDNAGANSIGSLTTVVSTNLTTSSTTNYTAFDVMGRVTASNQQTQGQSYPFTYVYNLAGALTSETYPSGRVVTTSYNGLNLPFAVNGQLAGAQTNYIISGSYKAHGGLFQTQYGNHLVRTWTYDNRLRPTALWDAKQDDPSQFLFLEYPTWNANGTLASKVTYAGGPASLANLPQFSQSFTHDSLKRLTFASDSGGWWQIYNYDQYGNMWIPSSSGLPVNGAMPVGNIYNGKNQNPNFSYDNAGNQSAFGSLNLNYDAENRLINATNEVAFGGGSAVYQYDGFGSRVAKMLPSGTTIYVYDALGRMAAEYSTVPSSPSPCTTCYLSVDHLGSTRMVTDQNATVVSRHDFAPFGQEVPSGAGRSTIWAASDNINQKFTGQEHDYDTALEFFQARYLASSLGRFMSPDPANASADLTNPQSWNAYAYVLGNPLGLLDPTGLDPIQVACPQCTTTVYSGPPGPLDTFDYSLFYGVPDFGQSSGQQPTFSVTTTAKAPRQTVSSPPTNGSCSVNAPGQTGIDFIAGAGDTLSFGATNWIRDQMGTNDFVNHNSGFYTAGEAGGVALSIGIAGAVGAEAATANAGKAGFEFSHWIPARMGGPRSLFNGNYVSQGFHYLTDPFRYPSGWRALGPKLNPALQQLLRIPWLYDGAAAGAAYGGASIALKSGGC